MALTIDSEMPTQTGFAGTGLTTYTFSFTNTAGTFLQVHMVGTIGTGDTITAMSYNGVAMDRIDQYVHTGTSLAYGGVGTLKNPATGSNTVSITMGSSSGTCEAGCISFSGQHASAPVGNIVTLFSDGGTYGSSSHPFVTVSSAADNIVTGTFGHGCNISAVDHTLSWRTANSCSSALQTGACERQAGAASVTTGYTVGASGDWVYIIGMEIVAAAGGAAAAARVPQSRPFPYKPGSPPGLR